MNLTFSKKLLIGQLFTFGLSLMFAVTVIIQINDFKDAHLIVTGAQYNHTVNMERIKLDVIQVQQWITDISATKGEDGLDDGLKKAEEYYQDLIDTLNLEIEAYKKENRPEKIEIIENIKKTTEVYYQTGKKMADLYMHQGTKSGNTFMGEFDKASEDLQNSLNPLVKETSDMFSSELANSDRKLSSLIKFSIGAIVFIVIIFILFTFIFNKNLTQQLSKVVKGLVYNSGDLESASLSLFEESGQIASSSTEQSMAVESSASALHKLSTTISSNAEYANQAKQATETGVSTTQKGIETLNEVLVSIDQISQNNIEVINEMQAMNKEVSEIVKVIEEIENKTKIINDIVFQTKLLSFNASVEAARAGEAGKGFAVVAEEVGNLSNMSGQAAKDISTLLQNGVSKIKRIVDDSNIKVEYLSQDGTKKVSSIMNVVNQSKGVLDEIVYNVENIQKMVNEIALASTEQSNDLNNISSSFSQIEVATKENAMIAENSNTQSLILKQRSENLTTIIQDFLTFVEGDNIEVTAFEWNDRFKLDVSSMDQEHQILIEKMNSFLSSLNQNNLESIKMKFSDLANYTVKHFEDEEAFMASVNFPLLANHKKIHQDLVSKVLAYQENLNQGKLQKQLISNFLKNWLGLHIVGQDKKYALHSRNVKQ